MPAPDAKLDDLWDQVRSDLRRSMSANAFETWVEPVSAVAVRGERLFVQGPPRVRDWFNRRYAPMAMAAIRDRSRDVREIVFTDGSDRSTPQPDRQDRRAAAVLPLPGQGLDFDRFIIGPGNRLAHSAALAVAESPGEAYNPLFVHGAPGLGKTHLLVSIAAYIQDQRPEVGVVYTTAERFTAEFITSLRGPAGGAAEFKRRHRGCGALLIDDVQFLEDKPKTAEEFFHTFNELYTAGGQIVLSSDRPPEALASLTDRLRDRFAWGLTVEVQAPDQRTRVALLRKLATAAGSTAPPEEALERIAAIADGNLRRLEGALTRVLAFASMLGEEPDRELVDRALRRSEDAPAPERAEAPTLAEIRSATCAALKVSEADLLGRRRAANVVRARQLAMFVSRRRTGATLAEIARAFGRDHSPVLHSIRTVERRLQPGSDVHRALEAIHRALHIAPDAE